MLSLNLKSNMIFAVAEAVVYGLGLFLLYMIIVKQLGPAMLGLWSLLLASTSAARLADMGLANGLNRFVAQAQALKNNTDVIDYIHTAMVSTFWFYSVISLLLYVVLLWLTPWLVPDVDYHALFREILPYAAISFIMLTLSSTLMGALGGLQRSDLKSICAIFGLLLQLLLAWWLVPLIGLKGAALAQLGQYVLMVVVGWVILRRSLPNLGIFPRHWRRKAFMALVGYGSKLQISVIANFAFEPLVKFMLAHYGGLAVLGYYEMASRMVLQVRSMVISAYQTLVPAFANLQQSSRTELSRLAKRSEHIMLRLAPAIMAAVVVGSPLVSWLWLGHIEPWFIDITVILAAGWLINMLVAPSYLLANGLGKLRGNIAGSLVTAAVTPVLSYVLGNLFGALGIVCAAMIALAIGGFVMSIINRSLIQKGTY